MGNLPLESSPTPTDQFEKVAIHCKFQAPRDVLNDISFQVGFPASSTVLIQLCHSHNRATEDSIRLRSELLDRSEMKANPCKVAA
jgi:hypothetical protein